MIISMLNFDKYIFYIKFLSFNYAIFGISSTTAMIWWRGPRRLATVLDQLNRRTVSSQLLNLQIIVAIPLEFCVVKAVVRMIDDIYMLLYLTDMFQRVTISCYSLSILALLAAMMPSVNYRV